MNAIYNVRLDHLIRHERRHSEDNILAPNRVSRTGTLKREKVAIPVFESGGVSPLKQLQRIKETDDYQTLPRSRRVGSNPDTRRVGLEHNANSHSAGELSKGYVDSDMGNSSIKPQCVKEADDNGNERLSNIPKEEVCRTEQKDDNSNMEVLENYYKTLYTPKPPVIDITKPETIRRKVPQLPSSRVPTHIPVTVIPAVKSPIIVTSTPVPRPVLDVKLVKHERRRSSQKANALGKPQEQFKTPEEYLDLRNSKNDIQKISVDGVRDSFMVDNNNRESIYHSVGDVQTLLKNTVPEEERIYSLPQPASYGEDTMKAVKKITDKYDTAQMRKVRALSFREAGRPDISRSNSSQSEPSSPVSPLNLSNISGTVVEEDELDSVFTEVVCVTSGITQKDIARLDLFYRGRGTEVTVCQCLADLSEGSPGASDDVIEWEPVKHTGVPVLIFNTGEAKRNRELHIAVAERETGFPLWKDRVNYLSNYKTEPNSLHVMHMSNNLRKVVGIKFYCESAAKEFYNRFRDITKDPNDDLWKISGTKDKKDKKKSFAKRFKVKRQPSKKEISQPCNFSHITKVDPKDLTMQETFTDFVVANQPCRTVPATPESFRPRLSTT